MSIERQRRETKVEFKTRALSSQNPSHHSRVQLTSIKTPHNPNLPRWSHNMCTPLTPNPPQPPVRPTLASSPPAHWPPRSRDQTEASDWSAGRDQSQLFAGGAPGRLSCPPSSSACRREHTLLLPLRDWAGATSPWGECVHDRAYLSILVDTLAYLCILEDTCAYSCLLVDTHRYSYIFMHTAGRQSHP